MGKVYQSVRGVVQGTLQRRRPDPIVSAQAKGNNGGFNDTIEELEKIFVEGIGRLRAAASDDQAVVANQAQQAEQIIEGLRANIAMLGAELREMEEALHRKDAVSQKMEQTLSAEIRDLQSVLKEKAETLETRDSEINDLKSNRDVLTEQVTSLELAVQEAKGEAAGQAQQAEQVIAGLKANITGLEAKLREAEKTIHGKDGVSREREEALSAEIRDLQSVLKEKEQALESRNSEINELKSKRYLLVEQLTRLELAIQHVKGEATSQAQQAEEVMEGLKAKIATLEDKLTQTEQIVSETDLTSKGLGQDRDRRVIDLNAELEPQTNGMKEPAEVRSIKAEPTRETVPPDAFDRMIAGFSERTNVIGSIAALIVRDHVKALGESMKEFPRARLTELLDSLSGQIPDDELRAEFRQRFRRM
ncbi:MAG TPA: hypothetical protein VEG60_07465 [Candidatus Binatia bacterium]|nr:hypothetical protein [Candidatus Binatia bacterium]